jgi:hypothetical protein
MSLACRYALSKCQGPYALFEVSLSPGPPGPPSLSPPGPMRLAVFRDDQTSSFVHLVVIFCPGARSGDETDSESALWARRP